MLSKYLMASQIQGHMTNVLALNSVREFLVEPKAGRESNR